MKLSSSCLLGQLASPRLAHFHKTAGARVMPTKVLNVRVEGKSPMSPPTSNVSHELGECETAKSRPPSGLTTGASFEK